MVDSVFIEGTGCECDVTLDRWLKDALPMLPGVVRGVASRQLVLACREFFERSYAWQTLIENQNAKVGRKQYWLSPIDEFTNVVGVLGVNFDGDWLTRFVQRPIVPVNSQASSSSRPYGYYAAEAPDMVEVYPDLDTAMDSALTFWVAMTPKISVEHLPRVAEIKYYDAIMDGFLARMYEQPNKPYSAGMLAVQKRRSFNAWIARYAGQAKQGNVGAQNWRFPGGWGVRRFGQNRGV
jgi:hypothetical protein